MLSTAKWHLVESMHNNDLGKLTVYAPAGLAPRDRLRSVKGAAEAMAKQLNLSFEMVKQTAKDAPIYVYYEQGNDDPVPLYCDEGK
jgi:hypothetical protein